MYKTILYLKYKFTFHDKDHLIRASSLRIFGYMKLVNMKMPGQES